MSAASSQGLKGASKNKKRQLNKGKREATSPADEQGKEIKRKSQAAQKSTNMEPDVVTKMEEAMVEISAKVGECVTTNSDTVATLNAHSDIMCTSNKEIKVLIAENKRLTKRLDNLEADKKADRERITQVERLANTNAHALKNSNIVIEGIPENPNENCRVVAAEILKAIEKKSGAEDIISAYRIGHSSEHSKRPRSMVVKLTDPLIKLIIMENKWRLTKLDNYANIFLNDDLPPDIKKERRTLREIARFAIQQGYKGVKASGSKLLIEGRAYRYESIHLLPRALQLCNVKTRLVGDGLGFQGEPSFLSNFYPATLRMEQYSFSSAEQAYQFFKCRTCKRDDRATKILDMSKPREIKIAGDDITSTAVWEQHKEGFMRSICFSKFSQNPELMRKLIDTGDIPLYECTNNRWWGCGYHLDSPEWATTKSPGLNKMGTILMEVRKSLKKATCTTDALLKSPGSIIKSMQKLDQEILGGMTDEPALLEGASGSPVDMEVGTSEADLGVVISGAPSAKKFCPEGNEQLAPKPGSEKYDESVSSSSDSEDLMDPTDIDEDSVNISAVSTVSTAAIVSVTDERGKLDISKIKGWKIPKIKELDPSLNDSYVSSRTRRQQSLSASTSTLAPQAQSTPQVARLNRSHMLNRIRTNLNPAKQGNENS